MTADELLRLGSGDLEVELLPAVGGRMHRLRAFGHDVLRTPRDLATHREVPVDWGAYPMAPWCNRLAAVPTAVGDRVVRLPATYRDGTAIHGQVATAPWDVVGPDRLAIRGSGSGWPWAYEVEERVTVEGATVRIDLRLVNRADGPMPAGLGLHPWFRRPVAVRLAGASVVPSNVDPASRLEPVSGALDLRHLGPPADGLDGTWTELADPAVELAWPEIGVAATISIRTTAPACVALASPPDVDAVAIEPQTHLPGGLRRFLAGEPGGLVALAPGGSLGLELELRFTRA